MSYASNERAKREELTGKGDSLLQEIREIDDRARSLGEEYQNVSREIGLKSSEIESMMQTTARNPAEAGDSGEVRGEESSGGLESRIEELRKDISGLQSRQRDINGEISSLKTKKGMLQALFEEIKSKMSSLEGILKNYGHSAESDSEKVRSAESGLKSKDTYAARGSVRRGYDLLENAGREYHGEAKSIEEKLRSWGLGNGQFTNQKREQLGYSTSPRSSGANYANLDTVIERYSAKSGGGMAKGTSRPFILTPLTGGGIARGNAGGGLYFTGKVYAGTKQLYNGLYDAGSAVVNSAYKGTKKVIDNISRYLASTYEFFRK